MAGRSGSPRLWLIFPPLATNHFHPEVGLPELTAVARAEGLAVQQRDLNVELIYGVLTSAEGLAELALWVAERALSVLAEPRDERRWRAAILEAAAAAGMATPAAGVGLQDHLERERRRTNRSHRPDDRWRAERPPRVTAALLAREPRELSGVIEGFLELCAEVAGFWRDVVEALQYLLLAPPSFALDDVVAALDRAPPLLDTFYDGALRQMEVGGGRPDLVGVSIHGHDQLLPALRLLAVAGGRWPRATLVAGGPWCTAAQELLPRLSPLFDHLDAIVVGQGHAPLAALARRGREAVTIPGVARRVEGRVSLAPPGPRRPLAAIPRPTFDGLELSLYPQARLPIRLHDGCGWGKCRFCYHLFPGVHGVGEPPLGEEALDSAVRQVAELRRQSGIRAFTLLDHAVPFVTLQGFARRVREAGLDVEWDTMARFEPGLRAEGCRELVDGGGREVFLGVETISPEGLRRLGKGLTVAMIEEGISAYAEAGFTVRVFLLNYPGQRVEELRDTLAWALDRFPLIQDAMLGRVTLARGTRCWEHRGELGLPEGAEAAVDCDLFQVTHQSLGMIPFDDYLELWQESRERFQRARTAADEASLAIAEEPTSSAPSRRPHPAVSRPSRVTLVGTGISAEHAQGESRRYNMATASLAAFLGAQSDLDVSVSLIDEPFALGSPRFDPGLVERVLDTSPDVLGLSCYAWDLRAQLELARAIKGRSAAVRVVLGGPSATHGAARLLAEHPAVDVVLRGEGEETLAALLRSDWGDLSALPGVAWRTRDGEVQEQALGPPVADLATLRSPYLDGVIQPPRENLMLEFSRGCLYRCKHCAWQTHGRGMRYVPVERVRAEITWARQRRYQHGFIIDSAVNNHDEWVTRFAGAVTSADPRGEVLLSYFLDYRRVSSAQARALSPLRTHEVLVGLESTNSRALRATGRPAEVAEAFTQAVDLLAETVGPVTPNIMFGMPGDDLEGFRDTLDFIAALDERPGPRRIRQARVHWAIVPPGSYFARNMARYGLEVHDEGVPYVLSTSTMRRGAFIEGLRLLREHPRADLFIWEDAEPVTILGGELPSMTAPGSGRLGAPAPDRTSDEEVLAMLSPLTPGRVLRGFRLGPIERSQGHPLVTLTGAEGVVLRLELHPNETVRRPLARTRSFDIVCSGEPRGVERTVILALSRLIEKNDR